VLAGVLAGVPVCWGAAYGERVVALCWLHVLQHGCWCPVALAGPGLGPGQRSAGSCNRGACRTHHICSKQAAVHCSALHCAALQSTAFIICIHSLHSSAMPHHVLCRWDTETVGCRPSLSSLPAADSRSLADALAEVAAWLAAPGNERELLLLYLDDQRDLQVGLLAWLVCWCAGWRAGWCAGWCAGVLAGVLVCWLVCWCASVLAGVLVRWLVCWCAGALAGVLVCWLVCWCAGWRAGVLVRWPAGVLVRCWLAQLSYMPACWLPCWAPACLPAGQPLMSSCLHACLPPCRRSGARCRRCWRTSPQPLACGRC
jgi:hypothetical protein